MTNCAKCGAAKAEIRVIAEFDASGLLGTPFSVFIHEAVKEKYCLECGAVIGHVIPNPDNLIAVAAIFRACDPSKLSGAEIRFLRKSLCLKAKDMAARLDISAEQFSRYENGSRPISEVYEKLLRAMVCIHHLESAKTIDVDIRSINSMNIISARDVGNPLSYRLIQVPVDEPNGHGVKWRNEAA